MYKTADKKNQERLKIWIHYFKLHQVPKEVFDIKRKIDKLESTVMRKKSTRKEGYIDPYTKKFMIASNVKMRAMMSTNPDEKIRKACFDAGEKLAHEYLNEYLQIIQLRNQFAKTLGYDDFYDYKVRHEDGMTKDELFGLFDNVYQKTKYAFIDIRKLEKTMPGLRKPWNFNYMMAGDFIREADPYFQFENALIYWGQSFAALGIDFQGGSMQLDLLDRKGKFNNGFCHWPDVVHYEKGKRISGTSNFTCNVVPGQVGSGTTGMATLFHEGGHAAHFMNTSEREIILNQESEPMSTAWAEVHSMFLEAIFSSVEWRTRYAQDAQGNTYPFDLFERRTRKLHPLRPTRMHSIIFVANLERELYETKNLTTDRILKIVKKNFRKYFDQSVDSLFVLNIVHIYDFHSSASYHGYGLAELAVYQWRDYFYKKYGYIVDNPNIGKEMQQVWKFGSRFTYKEFVKMMTGKKISADAYLRDTTLPVEKILKQSQEKIKKLESVKRFTKPVNLNTRISMVHGKTEIANNKKSFEHMAEQYKKWLQSQIKK
jgi:oligoendopeptidase F